MNGTWRCAEICLLHLQIICSWLKCSFREKERKRRERKRERERTLRVDSWEWRELVFEMVMMVLPVQVDAIFVYQIWVRLEVSVHP